LKKGRRAWVPPFSWDFAWPTLRLARRVLTGENVPGWWPGIDDVKRKIDTFEKMLKDKRGGTKIRR
jgi:hypothetical protein